MNRLKTTAPVDDVYRIIHTDHHDPFQILGPHLLTHDGAPACAIRAFLPGAAHAWVVMGGPAAREVPMERVHPEGFFEAVIPGAAQIVPYRLRKITEEGASEEFHDSYSYLPTLTDLDIYLFNAGDHHRIYEKLGAHFVQVGDVGGIQFAVWAPGARSVSVIGDFNGWDRRRHAMRVLGASGIWEIFIPGLPEGELYKFQVKTQNGFVMDKTDPYGFEMEVRPRTAARVNLLGGHAWEDAEWMAARGGADQASGPMAVYEVHLGSWRRTKEGEWLSYAEAGRQLVEHMKEMGFTHVEFLPVMEHPLDASWGYQVTGYFAPTRRFGSPQEFMELVDLCHRNGIGVILDWVPAHFPMDPHALGDFDGTHLYEHSDPRQGVHQDWGTYIFNFGRKEVRNFLISNALFWLDRYHIDGLRIDAVASMLYLDYSRKEGDWVANQYGGRENLEAVDFLKSLNGIVHHYYPGVLTIAEESTAWPGVTTPIEHGGLGFDLKWNMGWMHDILEYFGKEPVHRAFHQRNLTFVMLYAFTERFLLPLSHDEVVHGKSALLSKMPGDMWQKLANLRALLALMIASPGKKLLFMGGEIGQWDEWNHERSLDWHLLQYPDHVGVRQLVRDLLHLYRTEPALYEIDFEHHGFQWIDFQDAASSIILFERLDRRGGSVVVACNFTPVTRVGYRVGVREEGKYRELLNTDSGVYGGGNTGNYGSVQSDPVPFHGRPHSLSLTIPALGLVFLRKE